ncbi:MAG: cation diffusion facilitator family transporter [Pseudomonadota bacterium]
MHYHDHSGDNATHYHPHSRGHRAFGWALMFTLGFAAVEAIAGLAANSLALVADAGHMLTDSLSLGLAAFAAWLSRRPPSPQHSYGLARAEVVAALINSLIMLALVAFIVFEAWQRFAEPRQIQGAMVFVVAAIGLGVNLAVGWLLMRGEESLNRSAALLHVAGDALGSIAALAAGLIIMLTGWTPIDPILSVVISLLILVSTLNLLRKSLHVLMEGVPSNIDLNMVGQRLAQLEHVARVHDLHIWTLASGQIALSAHLDVKELAHWPQVLAGAQALLQKDFGIGHITLQPEVIAPVPVTLHARRPHDPPHDHAQ